MEQRLLEFRNNKLLSLLYGVEHKNLSALEQILEVDINDRGNILKLSGDKKNIVLAEKILKKIYEDLEKSGEWSYHLTRGEDISHVIKELMINEEDNDSFIMVKQKRIQARTDNQKKFIQMMKAKDIVFGIGSAGSGKTFLAVAYGLSLLMAGAVKRMVVTRPVVEAGENLGFLPGEVAEKIDPYLRPIDDAMMDMIGKETIRKLKDSGQLEIAPLAYMRGRTLKNSFILLDEAQNTKKMQMRMFLTRLGQKSKMIITGDGSQTDLAQNNDSGLEDALKKLQSFAEIGVITFDASDVQRHSLVSKIILAYNNF